MIRYKCERCKVRLESPQELSGKQDQCPACGYVNSVPERSGKSTRRYVLVLGLAIAIVGIMVAIAVSMSGVFREEQVTEKPERPNAQKPIRRGVSKPDPKPEPKPDMSLGKLARFKPLLDDYGATFKDRVKTPKGHHAIQYALDVNKAVGHILLRVDDADNVIDIECMFGLTQDSPATVRIHSSLYSVAVCRLCKDWTVEDKSRVAQAIFECVTTAAQKENKQAARTVMNNGIEAKPWFNATLAIGGLSLKRTAPATEHPTPWVYESALPKQPPPIGNPLIGISGITYRLIESEFGQATVGWQVTVTNKSSASCSYYVKISFRDKNNFEVAWSNGNTLVVPAGQSYKLSEQTTMKNSIWQQVTTASVFVNPSVGRF